MPFKFTFHYVSIKTTLVKIYTEARDKFTFHYVSIKTYDRAKRNYTETNLHSTMYLLKPTRQTHKRYKRTFTFHYVSIKTKKIHICIIGVRKFTFHYVSIKTAFIFSISDLMSSFTFHYVSIKTRGLK